MTRHRNDIYGELDDGSQDTVPPPIPAATVLLLREDAGIEVLMLHKTSKIAFGGMWVFPGGRIDESDYEGGDDTTEAARHAAMREAEEEAGILIPKQDFVWFAHWTPPPITPKRFATWFFVTATDDDHAIRVDGGEIQDHRWLRPADALEQHAEGTIDLAPPTWVSLYHLARFNTVSDAMTKLSASEPRYYATRIVETPDGHRIALWEGDAGYDTGDAAVEGPTHRLIMKKGGFEFLHSGADYL